MVQKDKSVLCGRHCNSSLQSNRSSSCRKFVLYKRKHKRRQLYILHYFIIGADCSAYSGIAIYRQHCYGRRHRERNRKPFGYGRNGTPEKTNIAIILNSGRIISHNAINTDSADPNETAYPMIINCSTLDIGGLIN